MKQFITIASEHFKMKEEMIHDSLTAKDVPEWDSMNYLLFIADLEKEYGISFSMDEVLSANSLGEIKKIIIEKGVTL